LTDSRQLGWTFRLRLRQLNLGVLDRVISNKRIVIDGNK
jgi:hypothetical protein